MARNKFDVDEELNRSSAGKILSPMGPPCRPLIKRVSKVPLQIILANLGECCAPVFKGRCDRSEAFPTRIKCSCFDRCCVCCDTVDR